MSAITLPFDFPGLYRGLAVSMYTGAAVNEGYACVIAGTADQEVIQSSTTAQAAFGFIKYNTGKTFNVAGAAQIPIATLVNVFITGVVIAVASTSISKGARVGTASGGQVVTYTAASAFVGYALTAAAGQHEWFALLIGTGTAA